VIKLKYTFKSDVLFKILFVKYPDLLKKLVAELLSIQLESIEQFEIRNPEMPPESLGSKFCRLDISMTVNGQRINLEIQVKDQGDFPERTLFYWAREYSTALGESQNYSLLPRTIIISIVHFKLFDCKEFHSEFCSLEVTRHTLLTDKMSLHYFELPKLSKQVSSDNILELWLSLFNAKTEEELSNINKLGVPVMDQAIGAYRSITSTPEFREIERLRSKARHDEAQALKHAEELAEKRERAKWQSVIAKKDAALANKDAALADKDIALANRDAALADRDALISELYKQLGREN